jgi:hypothetical protein
MPPLLINDYVVTPLLTYAGLAVSATLLAWLLWFGHCDPYRMRVDQARAAVQGLPLSPSWVTAIG